eukprot:g41936.t1
MYSWMNTAGQAASGELTFWIWTLLQKMKKGPDPKCQLSCSPDAAWPAVFIQLHTLLSLGLYSLEFRRMRGDLIETLRIHKGHDRVNVERMLPLMGDLL